MKSKIDLILLISFEEFAVAINLQMHKQPNWFERVKLSPVNLIIVSHAQPYIEVVIFFFSKYVSITINRCSTSFFSRLCKFNKLSGFWAHQFHFVLLSCQIYLCIINSELKVTNGFVFKNEQQQNVSLRQNAYNLIITQIACNFCLLLVVFFSSFVYIYFGQ